VEGLVNLIYHLAIPQGTFPWHPIKVAKLAFFADQSYCCAAIPKRTAVSQFLFQKIKWHEFSALGDFIFLLKLSFRLKF